MYYYQRKSNPLKWIILLIILIVIGFGIYWFYVNYFSKIDFSKESEEENMVDGESNTISTQLLIKISLIEGDVLAEKDGQGLVAADDDLILHQGDRIKTGDSSFAILNIENGSIIRLGSNTEIILDDLASDNFKIKQIQGRSYHNFNKISNYQIESLKTVWQATDSIFEVITNEDRGFLVGLVFDNEVTVTVNDEKGLLKGSRLKSQEKALIDLNKSIENILEIQKINLNTLRTESWYERNFELDKQVTNEEEVVEDDEEEDDEPDFMEANDSLELASEVKDNGVFLSWSVYNQDDFNDYQIVRSRTNNNLKYPETTVIKKSSSKGYNSYLDSNAEPAQKYYYRVCVRKGNDKVVCGNVVSAVMAEEEEEVEEEEEKDVTAPKATTLLMSVLPEGIKLSWLPNLEDDFKEYRLVRSITSSSPSYPGAGSISVNKKGQESYLDKEITSLTPGTFYYRICSLDTVDNSACSNVMTITDGQIQ